MKALNIETRTHGRLLLREVDDPLVVIVGFHGYTENADIQMERLLSVPGSERWTLVSVQGLHRFYRGRSQDVIASWMTRQDRDLMIADNIEYAARVLDRAVPDGTPIVTSGFSQGVAMAFRCAVRSGRRVHGVIAAGGDIPPELLADQTSAFPPTLLLRGRHDDWYTAQKLEADRRALEARGFSVRAIEYDAGHEWTAEVSTELRTFVDDVCTP